MGGQLGFNYASGYARLFMQLYPEHTDVFRTRKLRATHNQGIESETLPPSL